MPPAPTATPVATPKPTPAPTATPVATGGAPTLLAYLKTLGAGGGGFLSGQTLDPFSSQPLDAIDSSGGAGFPNISVSAPGPNTGLFPAIVDLFLNWGASEEAGLSAPNDLVTIANNSLAKNAILHINYCPQNPNNNSYSNTTFDPNVLVPGTNTYNNFIAIMAADAAKLKKINGPFIFDPYGEFNLGGYWSDMQSGATPAQFAQLWILTYNYFMVTEGLAGKMLWSYEAAGGVGNYTWGFPGTAYVDIIGSHSFAYNGGSVNPASEYAALSVYGLPMIVGSTGWQDPNNNYGIDAANFSQNSFTQIAQVISQKYPKYIGAIWWSQSSAINSQNGAAQTLSSGGWLNSSNLPSGIQQAK